MRWHEAKWGRVYHLQADALAEACEDLIAYPFARGSVWHESREQAVSDRVENRSSHNERHVIAELLNC
jgi:hypothetical protein